MPGLPRKRGAAKDVILIYITGDEEGGYSMYQSIASSSPCRK